MPASKRSTRPKKADLEVSAPQAQDEKSSAAQGSDPEKPDREQLEEKKKKKPQTAEKGSPARGSGHGAQTLMALNFGVRLITFLANQVLLRYLTPGLLGLATQLEVYYISVLFFARESLRVAVQRHAKTSPQGIVNLGYLAVVLGLFVSLLLGAAYWSWAEDATKQTPFFLASLRIYGLAAMLELLAEPTFLLTQVGLQFRTRALAESAATCHRCAATLATAVLAHRAGNDMGVLPFALGQLSYGLALLLVYLGTGVRMSLEEGSRHSVFPRRIATPRQGKGKDYVLSYFYRPAVNLAASMMAQSVVRHILTQGDTFMVSVLSSQQAQGVYALANNYGGLLSRLVFQPIEEASRNYYSSLLAGSAPASEVKSLEKKDTDNDNDNSNNSGAASAAGAATAASPRGNTRRGNGKTGTAETLTMGLSSKQETVATAARELHASLRLYMILSAVVMAVSPVGAPHLLSLVAGRRWALEGAGDALAAYCYYVPLLAINGLSEAFVASVATTSQVHRQSAWMGLFSLAFAAAGYLALRVLDMGATGLVLANCVNMACRIAWSLVFVRDYFSRRGVPFRLGDLPPGLLTIMVVCFTPRIVGRLTGITARTAVGIVDIIKLGFTALPFVLLMAFDERRFLCETYKNIMEKRDETKNKLKTG